MLPDTDWHIFQALYHLTLDQELKVTWSIHIEINIGGCIQSDGLDNPKTVDERLASTDSTC